MKLARFEQQEGCRFILTFDNAEIRTADLQELIGQHVAADSLCTARIDPEWGCLEFMNGRVDLEPWTLYRYVCAAEYKQAA